MYIQAALIVVTVIATYILYFIYRTKNLSKGKYVKQIKTYLLAISDPKELKTLPFKKHWKKVGLQISAIKEIEESKDKSIKLAAPTKLAFIELHMLPIARKYAQKSSWFARFLAANAFALHAMPEDEKIVASLIRDYKPAVAVEAIHAVAHLPTESLTNLLIDKTATLRRKSYDLYLEPFKHFPVSARDIIVKRLDSETDPFKRDICYRILMFFKPKPLAEVARKDAKSKTIELCVSAIHFMAYAEEKAALPFLHEMLSDPRWQVKVAVLHALGKLRDKSSVNVIAKMLKGSEKWIRINAANTLNLIDKGGIKQ